MSTAQATQYIFNNEKADVIFDYECDNTSTPLFSAKESKTKILLAALSFGVFASVPAKPVVDTVKFTCQCNVLTHASEIAREAEQATSFSLSTEFLESFVHKPKDKKTINEEFQTEDSLDTDTYYHVAPKREYVVEMQLGPISKGDFTLSSDWYDELEETFYEV